MSELRRFTFNHRDADADFKNKLAKSAFEEFRNDFFDYSELNKLKSEVEWDVFWNIVEEVAIKSGIDPKDLNRVRPSTIVGVKDVKKSTQLGGADVAGFFNYELNIIAVDYSTVKRDSEKYGLNEKIHAMLLVFHEYVHSFSASSLDAQSFESRPFFAQVSESRVGYEKKKTVITKEGEREEKIMSEQDFWYLNEALTEGLAYNILSEYAKRTGSFSNVDLAQYEQSLVENRVTDYPYIVGSVKAMCSIVGKKIGIDGGIVWNSLVRGIFKNGTIETEEIKNYFTETFDNKFLPRLSKIKTVEEMVVFLKDYKV